MILLAGCDSRAHWILAKAARDSGIEYARYDAVNTRLTPSVALAARCLTEVQPDALVVAGEARADSIAASDSAAHEIRLVYEIAVGSETLYPDNPFVSGLLPSPPDVHPTDSFAGTVAAGMALLGSSRVVGVVIPPASPSGDNGDIVARVALVLRTLRAELDAAARRRTGGGEVQKSGVLAATLAERLRLSRSQALRLTHAARSAAIRARKVPAPLLVPTEPGRTKQENATLLAGLINQLEECGRVGV